MTCDPGFSIFPACWKYTGNGWDVEEQNVLTPEYVCLPFAFTCVLCFCASLRQYRPESTSECIRVEDIQYMQWAGFVFCKIDEQLFLTQSRSGIVFCRRENNEKYKFPVGCGAQVETGGRRSQVVYFAIFNFEVPPFHYK